MLWAQAEWMGCAWRECTEGSRTSKQKGPGMGLQTCAPRGTQASEHDCLTRGWKE